jgi:hypothetical protein
MVVLGDGLCQECYDRGVSKAVDGESSKRGNGWRRVRKKKETE